MFIEYNDHDHVNSQDYSPLTDYGISIPFIIYLYCFTVIREMPLQLY